MPQTFKIKNSVEADKVPAAGDLATAELALNLKDQKLYSKDADGNVFQIGADQDLSGFVKLDDSGTKQSITGGGGIDLAGGLKVEETIKVNTDATSGRPGLTVNGDVSMNAGGYAMRFYGSDATLGNADGYTLIQRDTGSLNIKEAGGWGERFLLGLDKDFISVSNDNDSGKPNPITGGAAVVHVYNGLNTQFGTNAAQLGNVAPLNDWSCYPARSSVRNSQPAPPAPEPESDFVDPGFGVDEPTFSAGFTSGGIVSGGIIGTQDIIDLEGE